MYHEVPPHRSELNCVIPSAAGLDGAVQRFFHVLRVIIPLNRKVYRVEVSLGIFRSDEHVAVGEGTGAGFNNLLPHALRDNCVGCG